MCAKVNVGKVNKSDVAERFDVLILICINRKKVICDEIRLDFLLPYVASVLMF